MKTMSIELGIGPTGNLTILASTVGKGSAIITLKNVKNVPTFLRRLAFLVDGGDTANLPTEKPHKDS